MLFTPSLCHKLSHLLGPPPLERDVLYGRPLSIYTWTDNNNNIVVGLFNNQTWQNAEWYNLCERMITKYYRSQILLELTQNNPGGHDSHSLQMYNKSAMSQEQSSAANQKERWPNETRVARWLSPKYLKL